MPTEDSQVIHVLSAEPHAGRKNGSCDVQIEKERKPCCRLMFGNTSNDRDVDFSISGIPERIKTT